MNFVAMLRTLDGSTQFIEMDGTVPPMRLDIPFQRLDTLDSWVGGHRVFEHFDEREVDDVTIHEYHEKVGGTVIER